MEPVSTLRLSDQQCGISQASRILNDGGLVAFPTETVYGLGADATNDVAVANIFDAKARPTFNPLIVHLPSLTAARKIAIFNEHAIRLAETFWPGPLTIVAPLRENAGISHLVTAGLQSIAIRVPAHPLAHDILTDFGGPIAAPSANPSGKISPTTADHVLSGLSGRIQAVVDGGACDVGLESTIVGCVDTPTLLRPGGLPSEAIEACLGHTLIAAQETNKPSAPGQLKSHYAPMAQVHLNQSVPEKGDLWLGFGPNATGATLNLSRSGDLVEAAANLFGYLHRLDGFANPGQGISVSPIPNQGLGRAINDRLQRAAAPRP